MKKYLVVVLVAAVGMYMFGCGKKQAAEELQESMSMESLGAIPMTTPTSAEVQAPAGKPAISPAAPAIKPEVLPPAPANKPTAIEIQMALKNAGLYAGEIDGKIGPKTKKAIEDFQKEKGLKPDGKVGSQTWALLSAYLNPAQAPTKKKR